MMSMGLDVASGIGMPSRGHEVQGRVLDFEQVSI